MAAEPVVAGPVVGGTVVAEPADAEVVCTVGMAVVEAGSGSEAGELGYVTTADVGGLVAVVRWDV